MPIKVRAVFPQYIIGNLDLLRSSPSTTANNMQLSYRQIVYCLLFIQH
ncbi:hypothetical protein YPPY66_4088 [Yersinia pestis PY-66]|nr:hypothetical protein YPPY06_3808 [Yersinia pestis PY-06]EIR16648.1 hypothetical protein YPPY09_3810 [Yersinia pestis PY-09]EIR29497.1 hypothetical protein YPPY11_3894 [Yersinia pestis PY-11]EIR44206.1 hypothetical protein YPPY15_3746 [Yersinia pestis PY-15]EIR56993.1 hypothetical protein YPPY16_3790 [Yersinia pestis PY-16]EIR61819.1 hypothetical protein YPPY25_3804 [Yersinia pestis PY-25]EIR73628.1 hypothetical protein YPPY32_4060 [Yersinia pestis PY-32]EIS01256.1 hypothetical protein YPP